MSESEAKTEQVQALAVAPKSNAPSYELAAFQQIDQLTVESAQADIWPKAPLADVRKAVHIAKARGANPWCDEIYLIPRKEKQGNNYVTRWVIQMSQNYVIKVATSHPACDGWQDGVIVQENETRTLVDLAGCFVPKGWTLVGSWFKGYRKGWKVPITKRVNLEEYSTGMSTWKKLESTMIVKVARTQGLREMLPDRLAGMYDAAEMDQMGEVAEVPGLPEQRPVLEQQPAKTQDTKKAEQIKKLRDKTTPTPTPPPQAEQTPPAGNKDEAHLKELTSILMQIADDDKLSAQNHLKKLSTFEGDRGPIFIDSLKDPKLKGKWLNRIIVEARKDLKEWVEFNDAGAPAEEIHF